MFNFGSCLCLLPKDFVQRQKQSVSLAGTVSFDSILHWSEHREKPIFLAELNYCRMIATERANNTKTSLKKKKQKMKSAMSTLYSAAHSISLDALMYPIVNILIKKVKLKSIGS